MSLEDLQKRVISLFEDVCEKRKCHHYQRLYVNLNNR